MSHVKGELDEDVLVTLSFSSTSPAVFQILLEDETTTPQTVVQTACVEACRHHLKRTAVSPSALLTKAEIIAADLRGLGSMPGRRK